MTELEDSAAVTGAKQVERAGRILLSIAEQGSGSVRDLANRLDIDRNAVHRSLVAFSTVGLVTWSEPTQQYLIGPAALQLAAAYRQQADLVAVAIPYLDELQRISAETAVLVTLVGDVRLPVYQVQSEQPLRYVAEIGKPRPLHLGAAGLVILASLPITVVRGVLDRTGVSATTAKRTLKRLELARAQGWIATEGDTRPEVAAVAAPIIGPADQFASVVVCGPIGRLNGKELARLSTPVVRAAQQVSEALHSV